jgi:hypothetical protein
VSNATEPQKFYNIGIRRLAYVTSVGNSEIAVLVCVVSGPQSFPSLPTVLAGAEINNCQSLARYTALGIPNPD